MDFLLQGMTNFCNCIIKVFTVTRIAEILAIFIHAADDVAHLNMVILLGA